MKQFSLHLKTLSGGDKNSSQRKRTAGQMRKICIAADLTVEELYRIGSVEVLNKIENHFVQAKRKDAKTASSTIKCYTHALSQYATYLRDQNICPDTFTQMDSDRLKCRKANWSHRLNLDKKVEDTRRIAVERQRRLTPKDLQNYAECQYTQTTEKMFTRKWLREHLVYSQVLKRYMIKVRQWSRMRDHLITIFCGLNALRPSGLCGMRLDMVKQAIYFPQTDNYIIEVTDIKDRIIAVLIRLTAKIG